MENEKKEFKKFSKQELKVFELFITEYKSKEIAKILGLNEKTIGTYKIRLLNKSKTKTIIGLYLFNQKYNIVDLNSLDLNVDKMKTQKE